MVKQNPGTGNVPRKRVNTGKALSVPPQPSKGTTEQSASSTSQKECKSTPKNEDTGKPSKMSTPKKAAKGKKVKAAKKKVSIFLLTKGRWFTKKESSLLQHMEDISETRKKHL